MLSFLGWLKQRLPSEGLARNVMVLAGGTAVAQAITLVMSPVLTRLFTPADFGVLAVFSSALAVFSNVAAWRYEQAIPLPDDDQHSIHVVVLSAVVLACMGALTGFVVFTWPEAIVMVLGETGIAPYLGLLPLSLTGLGAYQIAMHWATRTRAYSLIARTKLTQQVWGQIITVPLGFLRIGAFGLLVGYVASQFIGVWSLTSLVLMNGKLLRRINGRDLVRAAIRFRKFPLVSTWAGLVNVVGLQLPVIYLSQTFSAGVVGHYSMANRVLGLPSALVGQAVAQVFYPHAVRIHEPDTLRRTAERLAVALFSLGLPVFAVMLAVGPQLFRVAFGNEWATAGVYAQILSPWFSVLLVSSPLSTLSLVKERQGLSFMVTVYELVLRLALMWLGGNVLGSSTWAVGMLSLAGCIISVVSISIMLRLIGCEFGRVFLPAAWSLVPVLPVALLLWVVGRETSDLVTSVLAIVSGLGLLYALRRPILEFYKI